MVKEWEAARNVGSTELTVLALDCFWRLTSENLDLFPVTTNDLQWPEGLSRGKEGTFFSGASTLEGPITSPLLVFKMDWN